MNIKTSEFKLNTPLCWLEIPLRIMYTGVIVNDMLNSGIKSFINFKMVKAYKHPSNNNYKWYTINFNVHKYKRQWLIWKLRWNSTTACQLVLNSSRFMCGNQLSVGFCIFGTQPEDLYGFQIGQFFVKETFWYKKVK